MKFSPATTTAHLMMMVSVIMPLFLVGFMYLISSNIQGLGFIIAIFMLPLLLFFAFALFYSFLVGIFTKSYDLILITALPILEIIHAAIKALLSKHSRNFWYDTLGFILDDLSWTGEWLVVSYIGLVLIVSSYYFYRLFTNK